MPATLAALESLLRTRQLDRTLTSRTHLDVETASCGITSLDAQLGGGFPRGHVSELVGPRSSGRTSVLLQLVAAATARGELVALVDALDMFDVESAVAAGVDLDRLLWIRGFVACGGRLLSLGTEIRPPAIRDMNQRALEQALRAFSLVLQAGNFGLVVFDVAEAPMVAIRRFPFTTWLRLQRMVEGRQTVCLLVGSESMARSNAGLTLRVGIRDSGFGIRFGNRVFEGLDIDAAIHQSRLPTPDSRLPSPRDVRLHLQTICA